MKRLQGKIAIVTGGGQGIGRAICRKFAEEGATVWVADLGFERARDIAQAITAAGLIANPIQVNVAGEASVRQMVQQVIQQSKHIDVLVNNAGVGLNKSVADTRVEEWDQLMAVNVRGVFLCSRHVLPHMRGAGKGNIINIGSCAGYIGVPLQTAYCASKGAVHQFTKALALELTAANIRVNAIAPGVVDTPMIAYHKQEYEKIGFDLIASVNQRQFGGIQQPDDVADMALFLASEESRTVHGTVMQVDGGVCAS